MEKTTNVTRDSEFENEAVQKEYQGLISIRGQGTQAGILNHRGRKCNRANLFVYKENSLCYPKQEFRPRTSGSAAIDLKTQDQDSNKS